MRRVVSEGPLHESAIRIFDEGLNSALGHLGTTLDEVLAAARAQKSLHDNPAVLIGHRSHAATSCHRQEGASLGVIGAEAEDLLEFGGRFFDPTRGDQDRGKDVVGLGILAIAPDGLPQFGDRLGGTSLPGQGQSEVDPRSGVIGVQPEGLPVLDDGFVLPAPEDECPTEDGVCLGVPGP